MRRECDRGHKGRHRHECDKEGLNRVPELRDRCQGRMRPLESIEHEPQKPDCSGSQGQSLTDERGRTPNPGRHAPAVAQPAEPQHHTKVGYGDEGNEAAQLNILNVGSCEHEAHWKSRQERPEARQW